MVLEASCLAFETESTDMLVATACGHPAPPYAKQYTPLRAAATGGGATASAAAKTSEVEEVTTANVGEYVHLRGTQELVRLVSSQCEHMKRGLTHKHSPKVQTALQKGQGFTASNAGHFRACTDAMRQLSQHVAGASVINVAEWRHNTAIANHRLGWAAQSSVSYFWKYISDVCDNAERLRVFTFITGLCAVPSRWPPLKINVMLDQTGGGHLPKVHTCFFTLDLPVYQSLEQCAAKFRYACNNVGTLFTES
jgi:hypothetical protein